MKRIGSQTRASLQEEGYRLVRREAEDVILENDEGGIERWTKHDDFAGFVFDVDGIGYEFVSSS